MNTLRSLALYLWKEWRDHRVVITGFAIAVPVLLVLLALVLSARVLADPLFASMCGAGGVAIAVLAIVSDLVPGEDRRGHLGFLHRMPNDLGAAFAAKAIFLAVVASGFAVYGYLAGAATGAVFAGGEWLPALDKRVQVLSPMAPVFVTWAFVVSCWLPRGALALPATVLVFGVFLQPILLVYLATPGLGASQAELNALCALLTAGALPVAWWSFCRGRRFEQGLLAATWRGLLATLVLFTPAWGHVAHEAYTWAHFDPTHARAVFHSAHIGEGGRYLFVNAALKRRGYDWPNAPTSPVKPLRVDLQTGTWEQVGNNGDVFLGNYTWSLNLMTNPAPRVALVDATQEKHKLRPDVAWLHWFDGRTGEKLSSGWSDETRPTGFAPHGHVARGRLGLGYHVFRDGEGSVYDPFRDRIYRQSELSHLRIHSVRVRPGEWLVQTGSELLWRLYDPDSGESRPARGMQGIRPDVILDDGRILATREGRVVVVDPRNGNTRQLDAWAGLVFRAAAFEDGTLLISLQDGLRFRLAHFDPESLVLTPIEALGESGFAGLKVVAVTGERTFLVIRDHNSIERVTVGQAQTEVLFPR